MSSSNPRPLKNVPVILIVCSHDMRTMSSLPDLEVYKAANECRLQQIEAVRHIEGAFLTMVIQPMASGAIKACDAKGGTPLGLTAQNHQCE